MDEILQHTQGLLQQGEPWIRHYGLAVIALGGVIQALPLLGTLVPGLAVNLVAGFLCGAGALNLPLTAAIAWASFYAGTGAMFLLGRLRRDSAASRFKLRERLERALREDRWLLLYYCFAEPLRTVVPMFAGATDYPTSRWFLSSLPGSLLYVCFQLGLGLAFHAALAAHDSKLYLGLLALAFVLAILATVMLTRRMLRDPSAGLSKRRS